MSDAPVVIIGGGPTGMAAAALLASYQVRSIVFEREADVVSIPRAVHLDEEVLRILNLTCLGPEVGPHIRPIRGMQLVDADLRPLIAFARDGVGPHGFPRSNAFDQPELEQAMRRALRNQPLVDFRSSCSAEAIEHLPDGRLRVTCHDRTRDALDEVETPAVLACDGARSRARSFVGTELEDLGFDARWLVVDVQTDAQLGLYDGCLQVANPQRPTTYFCTGGGRHRWEIMLTDEETPEQMTCEENVRALLRPWLGAACASAHLRRSAVYTFHSLVARRWRRGNLFLLGDAAHQTPPFIGQGMGAGVRDAANLAWKVAAVVTGRASPALLDTYESERRPHVRSVIAQAVLLGKVMRTRLGGRYRNALLAKFGTFRGLQSRMLERAFPALDAGPLVRPRGSGAAGGHVPRANVEIDGRATHLDDALRDDFALLELLPASSAGVPRVQLRWLAAFERATTLVDLDGTLARWFASLGAQAVLVRPDRVVMASGSARSTMRWVEALAAACEWRPPTRNEGHS